MTSHGSPSRKLIVVFGAAVRADGSPSLALARRVGYAAAAAEALPSARLFLSGGVGVHSPSEAAVMAALLAGTIHPDRLALDEVSRDTLQSVMAAAAWARAHGCSDILVCTDAYHQFRVRMLFRLLGLRARSIRLVARGPRRLIWKMWFREGAAIPYDLIAGVAMRLRAWGRGKKRQSD